MTKANDLRIKNERLDNRVKLTRRDKAEMWDLHHEQGRSMHSLARQYGVSRRLVQFVLYPEKREANDKITRRTYDRETNTERCRRYRQRKRELLNKGQITKPKTKNRRGQWAGR